MAVACTFVLNRRPKAFLNCAGVGVFPAFSGQQEGRNNPASIGKPDIGPLPPGRYYIVDRQSGGRLGWLRDRFLENFDGTDREAWFALYRDDGRIDDETIVAGVRRGAFRLHPIGPRGLSEGCITLLSPSDFLHLRQALKKADTIAIAGGGKAYGTIDVS